MSSPRNTPNIPTELEGEMLPLTSDFAALARTYDTTISTATTVTLNVATRLLEVTAINQGVFLRYTTGVTSSNFDEYIHADQTRHYVVPFGVTDISVIEAAATANVVIIEKQ